METWFLATGNYHWLKLFETHMQSQYFPFKAKDAMGKEISQPFFGMLEPIQLYRYICPEDALGIVLKTLNADLPIVQLSGASLWAIRKALGLQEIPKDKIPNVRLPVVTENINIIPLGIKPDATRLFMESGVTQEAI